jgi:hypothetical protein
MSKFEIEDRIGATVTINSNCTIKELIGAVGVIETIVYKEFFETSALYTIYFGEHKSASSMAQRMDFKADCFDMAKHC